MTPDQILQQFTVEADAAEQHLNQEVKKLRTGRAHPSLLEGVHVTAYGANMPLIQVASVTVPEAQLLQISPFDPNNVQAIADAIRNDQSLGLNPTDDGRVVRVAIPALNEERRQQIVKQLGEKVEDCFIAMRQARHDALKLAEEAKKDRTLTEDDLSSLKKQLDDAMTKRKTVIDQMVKAKEAEIMKV